MLFVAYSGSSMYPTLREPALLDVVPYAGRLPRVGDVVYFCAPPDGRLFVHRIIRMTPAGVSTRGDNNTEEDAFTLHPGSLQGQVVAAWSGQRRQRIAGGLTGRLLMPVLHCRRGMRCRVGALLEGLHRRVASWGWVVWVQQVTISPRVVRFCYGEQERFRLLVGSRVVGCYDDQRSQWLIRQPYRFWIDKKLLPLPPRQSGSVVGRSLS